jgi:hypothetical protein
MATHTFAEHPRQFLASGPSHPSAQLTQMETVRSGYVARKLNVTRECIRKRLKRGELLPSPVGVSAGGQALWNRSQVDRVALLLAVKPNSQ